MGRWDGQTWQQRAWDRIEKSDGCWLWKGSSNGMGYGQFEVGTRPKSKVHYAHRFVYEQMVGPIPDGLELDHLCRNPSCCNPEHLEPVTHQQNMRRSKAATKTSCKLGHDWTDPHNVYIRHNGRRWCAECARARWSKKARPA